jgi:hypothetical protein
MHPLIMITLLSLAACSSRPPDFSKPAENAPMWDLNPGEWPGANAMIQPPTTAPLSAETQNAR